MTRPSSPLTLVEYQRQARSTAIYPTDHDAVVYTALGLAGEAGEVANNVKKALRDDKGVFTKEREIKIADELGDTLWYLAMCADEIGCTLEEIAERNLTKLAKRKAENRLKDQNR